MKKQRNKKRPTKLIVDAKLDILEQLNDIVIQPKKLLFLLLLIPSLRAAEPPNVMGVSEQTVAGLNAHHGNAAGRFVRHVGDGGRAYVTFEGGVTPAWAVNGVLEHLGAVPGYGTGGIDPFKLYSHEAWKRTNFYHYIMGARGGRDTWNTAIHTTGNQTIGIDLIGEMIQKDGPQIFKDLHEYELRTSLWRERLQEILPSMLEALKDKRVLLLSFVGVVLLIGLPMIIWNGAKAFFNWVFVRRPEVIAPEDTDIFKGFFSRLFHKNQALPEVIVNPELEAKLEQLEKENKTITRHNKTARSQSRSFNYKKNYKPYSHVVAYGEPGTGKTLFGKKLAIKSGMHYIYCTMADFAQMKEEDALYEFKAVLNYAKAHSPVVLIIDEFDIMFLASDLKMAKIRVLFQKFFPNATHKSVQLFCITNYPNRLPKPIFKRLLMRLYFDTPNAITLTKLFESYLLKSVKKSLAKDLALGLNKEDKKGLVGRDIQYITSRFALDKNPSLARLKELINEHKKEEEKLQAFDMDSKKHEKAKEITKPQKQKKAWWSS